MTEQFLSARDLANMHPDDARRYLEQVVGKPGDANFHPAVEAGRVFPRDFVAPPRSQPRTNLAQRGPASGGRYRY